LIAKFCRNFGIAEILQKFWDSRNTAEILGLQKKFCRNFLIADILLHYANEKIVSNSAKP
jgi:hypothetical protein